MFLEPSFSDRKSAYDVIAFEGERISSIKKGFKNWLGNN